MESPSLNPSESASAGHELSDVQPRPILIFAASFLVTLGIVYLTGWAALTILDRVEDSEHIRAFPAHPLSEVIHATAPEPRLEPEPSNDVLPRVDLSKVRSRENSLIGPDAWGWVDASHHFARIPIQAAMDLAVRQGLPTVLPATQPSAGPYMPPASALHGPGGIP
ncbi:MAG TPA: hypothetical protein VGG44_03725 [Tepidisphaeraceae bacterium]|jgi:hypothetical protein